MTAGYWSAAVTRPAQERRASHHIERQGFEYFLPVLGELDDGGELLRRTLLFPGYIFIKISDGWQALCSTRGIARMFLCEQMPTRISDSEIDGLRKLEDSSGVIRLPPFAEIGDRIEIAAEGSSFFGRVGLFAGMSGKDRCQVLISMLGREVKVEFERKAVRRCE